MKKAVIGILAHVDAGKTTLAEALLFNSGAIRHLGRVDHGDTALDTDRLETERGITIFAGEAPFVSGETEITLLDTPGHVDFSAETERVLNVLDYAVLVISSTDGVQSHTRTVWKLLEVYGVPTFIFVTKCDLERRGKKSLIAELEREFGHAADMTEKDGVFEDAEKIATCDEALLEEYLSDGEMKKPTLAAAIKSRRLFPVFFGSGLKDDGVAEFSAALDKYTTPREYPTEFGAKVYKITHDKNDRITKLRVTGGTLHVRDTVEYLGVSEKINQIRIYSGAKFRTADEAPAGTVCAVTGLSKTSAGMGLGFEKESAPSVLEPVIRYRIVLPEDADAREVLPKLVSLEEEDPKLKITYNERLGEFHCSLMGKVQAEIFKSMVKDRFDLDVNVAEGKVIYKETVEDTVEGVGHYEPLRHYAEVHVTIEPAERGSGVTLATKCSENELDRNWQRLVLTHLAEKTHLGVLTGSPLTDVKISLVRGRAHLKHTEGGDFRQATYRAVRQGLMQAKSVLLEPYYSFRLELPVANVGRAINDLRMMGGTFDAPRNDGDVAILRGKAPVVTMDGYMPEVA
ncbi:MAG: TetM/TetW/TetO/TetS family tetracycline resistance ribosomal protection protein, partial [Clostridia bacterium]|nr:TetM/TetW/TetO/TetS family tetracycline resistance ribosomal protection protein [Clostridia bacterium]